MKIYDALENDHRKVEKLLDQLLEASQSEQKEWKSLVDEIRTALIPHSRAEEAVFYNALRESDSDAAKKAVAHSYGEHAMAETELRALGAAKLIDANWTAMVQKLRKDLLHHIEEEEGRVFSAAKQVLSDEEALQIGKAFVQMKGEMAKDADSMVSSTIDLIANLLPKRFSDGFRKNAGSHRQSAA